MKSTRNKYLILNYIFLFCIAVLFLNDHVFKYAYANWLTGKLSDIAGIIIFPLLLVFVFPKLKYLSLLLSVLFFVYWKSPVSQPAIDLYNELAPIEITRVVDYTDLYVLALLPLPWLLMRNIDTVVFLKIRNVNPLLLLVPTVILLMATSPPAKYYFTRSEGNLTCYNCHIVVRGEQKQIIQKIKNANIIADSIILLDSFDLQHIAHMKKIKDVRYYRIKQLVLDSDTLRNIDFSMVTNNNNKTRIYFNGMQVADSISTYRLEKKLRKYYSKILFKEIKKYI